MTVALRPDTEAAVRDWLRGLAIPELGTNVFLGGPRSNAMPRVLITLVASTDDDYTDVLGEDEIQFDVVAASKEQACTVARYVAAHCKALVCGTPMGSTAVAKGARVVLGPIYRAEDARLSTPTGAPPAKGASGARSVSRYVIGARFSLVPSA